MRISRRALPSNCSTSVGGAQVSMSNVREIERDGGTDDSHRRRNVSHLLGEESRVPSHDGSDSVTTDSTFPHETSSVSSASRPPSSVSGAPSVARRHPAQQKASDVQRLLYTSLPLKHAENLPESPASVSTSVQEWQTGRAARKNAVMQGLTRDPSIVSAYFAEELQREVIAPTLSKEMSGAPSSGQARAAAAAAATSEPGDNPH